MDIKTRRRLPGAPEADAGVTGLYQAHAAGLVKLAIFMLGDRAPAEDVVQEAFFGLYRNWDRLSDSGKALAYVRVSVVNGCRAALRQRTRRGRLDRAAAMHGPDAESAESMVLVGEEHRAVLAAVRRLPVRQREALMLRFYLGVPEEETARAMGVSRGTVKSSTFRALASLARMLKEES